MQPDPTGRLPIPTLQEFNEACAADREIIACSALQRGPLTALTIGLRNSGIATVTLNNVGAHYLLEALKSLFPNSGSPPASPVKEVRTSEGRGLQVGHWPP